MSRSGRSVSAIMVPGDTIDAGNEPEGVCAILRTRRFDRPRGDCARTHLDIADGRIDSDVADAEWRKNTQIHQPPVTRRRQADVDYEDDPVAGQYIRARAARAHFEARLLRIQFERLAGSMLSTEDIRMAQFQIDRQHRDAMLNLADRLCAPIAAEIKEMLIGAGVPPDQAAAMDANRVHAIMAAQIRQALTEYADGLTDPAA